MRKIQKNIQGFTVIEILLVIVFIAVLFGGAWYVYKQRNQKTPNAAAVTATKPSTVKQIALKTYTNDQYGFSFQYPESWTLTTDLSDAGRGSLEGHVYVTSPDNTKVDFNLNQGGKGGDCWDDQANARTTRTCQTVVILSATQLSTSSTDKPIYFDKASVTQPTDNGGKTSYYVYITGGQNALTKTGSYLGAYIEGWGDITNTKTGEIGISVTGKDDGQNTTQAFFDTNEVKEATSVLMSFKLVQ